MAAVRVLWPPAATHGFNSVQFGLGDLGGYISHNAGCNDALTRGYGYTIMNTSPSLMAAWTRKCGLLVSGNGQPDDTEYNRTRQAQPHGTGYKIPCGYHIRPGLGPNPRHDHRRCTAGGGCPNVPITANVDAGFDPWDFYHYGPALDILESDNYYDVRLRNCYWYATNRIPVDGQAKLSYAVARSGHGGRGSQIHSSTSGIVQV